MFSLFLSWHDQSICKKEHGESKARRQLFSIFIINAVEEKKNGHGIYRYLSKYVGGIISINSMY